MVKQWLRNVLGTSLNLKAVLNKKRGPDLIPDHASVRNLAMFVVWCACSVLLCCKLSGYAWEEKHFYCIKWHWSHQLMGKHCWFSWKITIKWCTTQPKLMKLFWISLICYLKLFKYNLCLLSCNPTPLYVCKKGKAETVQSCWNILTPNTQLQSPEWSQD